MLKWLSFLKYPAWTAREYILHPYWSLKNTYVVLSAFWRTIVVGGWANIVLYHHLNDWSPATRGRYIWRAAHKFWAPWILERAGITMVVHSQEAIDWSKPHVVVANHTSTIDALVMVSVLPVGRVIAKKEALSFPIIGSALRLGAQIVVDRYKRAKNKDDHEAMDTVRKQIQEWPTCTILAFPEGTRTRDGSLGKFKNGSFVIAKENDRPIVPVAIIGGFEMLPKGSLLRFRPVTIKIVIGRPIELEFVQTHSVPEIALEARSRIEQMLQTEKV